MKAWILLMDATARSGWRQEALTRMEGSLLGYEDWQNDAFLKAFPHLGGLDES